MRVTTKGEDVVSENVKPCQKKCHGEDGTR